MEKSTARRGNSGHEEGQSPSAKRDEGKRVIAAVSCLAHPLISDVEFCFYLSSSLHPHSSHISRIAPSDDSTIFLVVLLPDDDQSLTGSEEQGIKFGY